MYVYISLAHTLEVNFYKTQLVRITYHCNVVEACTHVSPFLYVILESVLTESDDSEPVRYAIPPGDYEITTKFEMVSVQ